jgi:hypothetical protein
MKTGDDDKRVIFDDKNSEYGKRRKEGAADGFKHNRKLPGIIAYPFNQGVNCLAETSAEPGGLAFIPVLCVDQLSPRGLGEDN